MIHTVNPMIKGDKFDVDKPDGWINGVPYWLFNPRLHSESLRIDYRLQFVRYDVERDAGMYVLEEIE